MENHISSTVGIDVSKAHLDAHELPSGRSARSPDTTAIYAKVDLPMLQKVTQPWMGAAQ